MLRSGFNSASPALAIGELRIDRSSATATAGGASLALGGKVIATLLVLHENSGELVSKATLIERVWGDAPIDESSLWQNVHVLRGVLKSHAPGSRIETVKGRGYRFVSDESLVFDVPVATTAAARAGRRAPGWLWLLGGAAAAAIVFGAVHVAQPASHEHRVLVLVGDLSRPLPPLPPLPGGAERTQIVLAPNIRN